ncbi:hypothetical protein [Bacteroides uniformis]|uniref:hypothetical protein n=1 Tax=Bacteroides uniformis TaxID=820 RepID=UPI001C375EF2|nr:hypothetical protein [Bacteroides uniformis]MBV4354933.1 hypothetical protein [Bacteroides uniformis]MBV4364384.1 hypothetical protein [Bacteroides uniformis]MCB7263820.1 hypothetical protein [Bacteroides uniformis]MCG4966441.1 hypothetical protein [Bacteroides uniformis]MCG5018859.1 hypothetical protein [Bacteroides uniformis]
MRELFDITPHSTGPGFRMRLKTGEIDVPDGRGGYIVSSGMGSGKTESIKSLIRHKHDEGILYCVDTKDELEKMFGWIVENLVVEGVLRMEDVMIISSDPGRADFLGQYRDNPGVLMEKKVILITHVRFWTDLINHFLIYKPQKEVAPFDGDFRTLMGRDDLRGYVIFDETPTFINPFVEFDRSMLGIFGKTDEKGNIVCKPPEELGRYYDLFIRGGKNDLFNQAYRINRMKRDVVLGLIPKYYGSWVMSDTDKVGITFYPVDLCPGGMTISTHILIFEGAGNILFRGSTRFTLLDTESKYNTVTDFRRMDFGLSRKCFDEAGFGTFVKRIGRLIDKPSLIVCWKDINGDDDGPGKSGYAERFRRLLVAEGVGPGLFTVTYYGATDNKSTNSYRDVEQILLCGDWNLPNTESAKIRRAYGTSTDPHSQKDWYFSQLITRIGIRKHIEGEVYTVWHTDDFDERFIERMDAYFNENRVIGKASVSHNDWEKRLDGMKIRSNIKEEIRLLARYDRDMQRAITMDSEYTKEVTFCYLEMIGIKRGKRERGRYKALIDVLKTMGINLVIA